MANLTVRQVPDELVERLKDAARRNGRSMEQELRALLQERFGSRAEVLARIRHRWKELPDVTQTEADEWIRQARSRQSRGD